MSSGSSWDCGFRRCLGPSFISRTQLEPSRMVDALKRERINVLIAVPSVMALMRAHLLSEDPSLATDVERVASLPVWKRWWRLRRVHRKLGWRFWALICGGATLPGELESFWRAVGLRGDSGLWNDGDGGAGDAESSVQDWARNAGQAAARARGEDRRGWRGAGAGSDGLDGDLARRRYEDRGQKSGWRRAILRRRMTAGSCGFWGARAT